MRVQSKVARLAMSSAGQKINKSKTKVTKANTRNAERVKLDDAAIDELEDFTYLRSNISRDGGTDHDILARIGKARAAFVMPMPYDSDIHEH